MGAMKNYLYDNLENIFDILDDASDDFNLYSWFNNKAPYEALENAVYDGELKQVQPYYDFIRSWCDSTDERVIQALHFMETYCDCGKQKKIRNKRREGIKHGH